MMPYGRSKESFEGAETATEGFLPTVPQLFYDL